MRRAPKPKLRSRPGKPGSASAAVARRLGLRLVTIDDLTIARRLNGRGFVYAHPDGRPIRDPGVIGRLKRLAVPPAYADALYCPDPDGHLQAIWRDAVGRQQYRYHPVWEDVRAQRRLRRLARLTGALPRIRAAVTRGLAAREPDRELALAAVIDLVAISGLRAGRESYARLNGTRGAATLLKSNVTVAGERIALSFRAKGGKVIDKDLRSRRLAKAIARLRTLPGRRLFQYRDGDGRVRPVTARQVNEYLREVAGVSISLKDFRTLSASAAALGTLARTPPAQTQARRRKQVREVMQRVAERLGNTPTICRKSYVPENLVMAFESGRLNRLAGRRETSENLLAEVLAKTPLRPRSRANLKTQLERSVRALRRA